MKHLKRCNTTLCQKKICLSEVLRYLQAVAVSLSHLIEILCRLASGPLLARKDARLAVSDFYSEFKQSLRVQPI